MEMIKFSLTQKEYWTEEKRLAWSQRVKQDFAQGKRKSIKEYWTKEKRRAWSQRLYQEYAQGKRKWTEERKLAQSQQFRRSDEDIKQVAYQQLDELKKVTKNGCWMWTGHCVKNGYGILYRVPRRKIPGVHQNVHICAFLRWKGKVPKGKMVCHKCNQPPCYNPNHLYAGTNKENIQDAVLAGSFYKSWTKERKQLLSKRMRLYWTKERRQARSKKMKRDYAEGKRKPWNS